METGTIKNWMIDRGFGFIRRESDGADVFCHISSVAGRPAELFCGDRVQFEVGTDPRTRRPRAQNVRVIEGGHAVR